MTTTVLKVIGGTSEEEFGELFRNHCQFVYRTAYSVLRNRQDAEDVLQNLFLKLLERELPLDLTRSPQAYLYRAAVNLSLNVVRSRKNEVATDDFRTLERPLPDASTEIDDGRRQQRMQAIALLRPKTAEIVILRYAHNYSDAQIARMLGKSRGYVAVTLFRARVRLQRLVQLAEKMEETRETR
jgi:RNA polymerase sigma-70 factor (ECF subfamily)